MEPPEDYNTTAFELKEAIKAKDAAYKVSPLKVCSICTGLHTTENAKHQPLPNDMGRIVCVYCRALQAACDFIGSQKHLNEDLADGSFNNPSFWIWRIKNET